MFQAALLETMNTTFASCRTAVSISIALMPKAPSPFTEITWRPGKARAAAMPKGTPDAEAAERAGVQIGGGAQADPRKAQEIAAIGDRDMVVIRHRSDRIENLRGVDLAILAARRSGPTTGHALALLRPEAVCPIAIQRRSSSIAGSLGDRIEGQRGGRRESPGCRVDCR